MDDDQISRDDSCSHGRADQVLQDVQYLAAAAMSSLQDM